MQSKKEKTRDLSAYDFFHALQLEWIVADIRTKIYPNKQDKAYWYRVKEGKRRVIEDISEKNQLPNIFTDDEMKKFFEAKVYGEKGFPKFLYRDEQQKKDQEPFDLSYYYYKGTEVRFSYYDEVKVGIIKSYIPFALTVVVQFEDKELSLNVVDVTRIL